MWFLLLIFIQKVFVCVFSMDKHMELSFGRCNNFFPAFDSMPPTLDFDVVQRDLCENICRSHERANERASERGGIQNLILYDDLT